MVKKQLFSARRGLAIIVALSMVMSHGVTALAEEAYDIGSVQGSDHTIDTDGKTVENESKGFNSVSSSDGGAALTVTSSGGKEASATVDGDVTSTGQENNWENTGITASSSGNGSSTKVDVEGNVTSEREGTSKGIEVTGDSDVDIHVSGDVTAKAGGLAVGIADNVAKEGSNVTINVDGNVKTESAGWAEGIQVEGTAGKVEISVGGDVIQDGGGGHAIGISDTTRTSVQNGESWTQNIESHSTADIDISVVGDVVASNTAVTITKNDSGSHMDLVVEGTVKGEEHNIVLNSDAKTDNLNITVWKVDTSKTDGKIVENADGSQDDTTEKVETSINYIIKIDKDSQSHLSSSQETANQNEKVYLKLSIPSGYDVDSFYNAPGAADVSVVQDSSGNYYLVVPRGGGVNVGVKLKESGSTTNGESRTESGASDGEYWSPSSNNNNNGNASGAMAGYAALQGLQVHSMSSLGTDMVLNVADVLMPVDTLTAINNFMGNNVPTLGSNNVMGAGVVSFNNMFLTSVSDTVEVPVAANVAANQSYTVIFSDGTQVVVPCLMNGVLNIPFNKAAEGLTYIIYGVQMNPSMFIGMPMENV